MRMQVGKIVTAMVKPAYGKARERKIKLIGRQDGEWLGVVWDLTPGYTLKLTEKGWVA